MTDLCRGNAGATVFLTSESEWYKAAYYDPATSSCFRYATSTKATPIASGPTGLPNHANYDAAATAPTNVGAYRGTTSPDGAFDMNGNAAEWNEALFEVLCGAFGVAPGLTLHSA